MLSDFYNLVMLSPDMSPAKGLHGMLQINNKINVYEDRNSSLTKKIIQCIEVLSINDSIPALCLSFT
jgi:hypothetical protein